MANWRFDQSCTHHRPTVLAADVCGCFYCLFMFPPSDIANWIDLDERGVGQTALCPRCGIDAVVPSVPGRPVTDSLLARLHRRGFGEVNDEHLPK